MGASFDSIRRIGLGLLVLGCISAVVVLSVRLIQPRRATERFWTRCQELQQQLDELRVENSRLAQGASHSASDTEKTELLRLRNQAAQLKTATNELQRLRGEARLINAENQRLRAGQAAAAPAIAAPGVPADTFPKESWRFAGYATPEAAFQSIAWAIRQGDLQTLLASQSPEERAAMEREWGEKSAEEIAEDKRRQMNDVTGFRILERRQVADDQVALTIYAEGKGDSAEMLFQRIDNEWKFAGKSSRREPPGQ